MPYANGEIPVLGDYVKNDLEQPGNLTRLERLFEGAGLAALEFWHVVSRVAH